MTGCCYINAYLESTGLFSKICLFTRQSFKHLKKKSTYLSTLSVLKETTLNILKLPYTNDAILTQYDLSSHKQRPPIGDSLGLIFWVVTYKRFDCS